jgi:acyl carrier protein
MGVVALVVPGVHDILDERLGIGPELLGSRTLLGDDLGIDSLDLLEVVLDCESAFGIVVPEREIDHIRSVADLVHVVAKYVWERDSPEPFGQPLNAAA